MVFTAVAEHAGVPRPPHPARRNLCQYQRKRRQCCRLGSSAGLPFHYSCDFPWHHFNAGPRSPSIAPSGPASCSGQQPLFLRPVVKKRRSDWWSHVPQPQLDLFGTPEGRRVRASPVAAQANGSSSDDILIVAALVYAAYAGTKRGLVLIGLELISFIIATATVALVAYFIQSVAS